jgi:lipopolysaccharide heptosyltransferase I
VNQPSRILLIRPSALGDVCRSVPVLVSLRRAFPDATIHWLVRDTFADAVEHHPALDGVVRFPRTDLSRRLKRGQPGPTLDFLQSLRRARYDLVIDCQGLARSGLFAWITHAPRRVGFANARELGWLGLNERHHIPRDMHTVDRMLELLRQAGIEPSHDMTLHSPPAERERVASDPALAGRYAVLAPTSAWPGKRWPTDRFAHIAAALLERDYAAVVLTGAASERDQITQLIELAAQNPRIIDRVGATSVGGLMALIEHASLVIANDSAALHIAVGFDRPLVGLFGPTRVDLVGPYHREQDVIQHVNPGDSLDHKNEHTGLELMRRITAEEVLARVDQIYAKPRDDDSSRMPDA